MVCTLLRLPTLYQQSNHFRVAFNSKEKSKRCLNPSNLCDVIKDAKSKHAWIPTVKIQAPDRQQVAAKGQGSVRALWRPPHLIIFLSGKRSIVFNKILILFSFGGGHVREKVF